MSGDAGSETTACLCQTDLCNLDGGRDKNKLVENGLTQEDFLQTQNEIYNNPEDKQNSIEVNTKKNGTKISTTKQEF